MSKGPDSPILRKIIHHLKDRLLAGLLIIAPLGIAYFILRLILQNIDGLLKPLLEKALGLVVPGLGLISLLVLVYLTGLLVTNFLGRWLVGKGQEALLWLPLIRSVYSPVKQFVETFSGNSSSSFKRVVLVEYPKADCWAVGFLTGMTQGTNGKPMAIVYLPGAPTPYSGWVSMFPMEQVHDTSLTVTEAMNMIISGGAMAPSQISGILTTSSK